MSRPPRPSRASEPLTDRETQILALIAAGEPTRAISQRLGITQNTIKTHLGAIYLKTGSRNRVDAVRYYLQRYQTRPAADESPPAGSSTPAQPHAQPQRSLIDRQIQEIEARIDQLKPATGELERLQRALHALRSIDDSPQG